MAITTAENEINIFSNTMMLALGLPTEPVRPDALIKTYGMQSCH